MSDILIRGIKMPTKNPICVTIDVAGRARQYDLLNDCYSDNKSYEVNELHEHGDLIDVSKITLEYGGLANISPYDFVGTAEYFAKQIESLPVVIPASEEA